MSTPEPTFPPVSLEAWTKAAAKSAPGGDVNALNYFVANKYIEALKAMADSPNQKMLLLPIEATGVLGSLAGIAELAKNALDRQAEPRVAPPPRGPAPPAVQR